MPQPTPADLPRPAEALRVQYDVETALARRLRVASSKERSGLYGPVYDAFFRQFPPAPASAAGIALQLSLLTPFLHPETVFMEIGAGTCALALRIAERVRQVVAVEVASVLVDGLSPPPNVELLRTGTLPYPLPASHVDLAYSCHVIEHLQPDDALAQAQEIRRLLAPGGRFLCVTPHRFYGPHDISRYFDDEPTGFHLKEYGYRDLAGLLRRAGFSRVRVLRGQGRPPVPWPLWPYGLAETVLDALPRHRQRQVLGWLAPASRRPFRPLEQVVVMARG